MSTGNTTFYRPYLLPSVDGGTVCQLFQLLIVPFTSRQLAGTCSISKQVKQVNIAVCDCVQEVSVPPPLTAILTPNNSEPFGMFPLHCSSAEVRTLLRMTATYCCRCWPALRDALICKVLAVVGASVCHVSNNQQDGLTVTMEQYTVAVGTVDTVATSCGGCYENNNQQAVPG